MSSSWNIGKFGQGRLVRIIALLFLIHAGADLVFPQLCSEEPLGLTMSQSFAATDDRNIGYLAASARFTSSNESGENPRREESPREEDCFCCCTHVMPSLLFVDTSVADAKLGKNIQPNVAIISVPLNTPDHPPRFV